MRLIDVNITIKELNDKIARLDAKHQYLMYVAVVRCFTLIKIIPK